MGTPGAGCRARVNRPISRRVTDGSISASPAATQRTAASNCSAGASLLCGTHRHRRHERGRTSGGMARRAVPPGSRASGCATEPQWRRSGPWPTGFANVSPHSAAGSPGDQLPPADGGSPPTCPPELRRRNDVLIQPEQIAPTPPSAQQSRADRSAPLGRWNPFRFGDRQYLVKTLLETLHQDRQVLDGVAVHVETDATDACVGRHRDHDRHPR